MNNIKEIIEILNFQKREGDEYRITAIVELENTDIKRVSFDCKANRYWSVEDGIWKRLE